MTLIAVLISVVGCVFAAFGAYLVVLAIASFGYRQSITGFVPRSRLAVFVPAHDEELLVARTIRSLRDQTYPAHLYEIVVIADNCTDATAAVAAAAGAGRVLVRDAPDERGKGRALRWAMDQILEDAEPPAAIVSVDADTVVDPELLLALAERFEAGAPAVQADYRAMGDDSSASALRKVGFVLMNRARPAGRNVLGLSACLVGNGWLLSTELLRRRPWSAFTSTEDREYTLDLDAGGEFIAFAGAAAVHAPTAPNGRAAATQQERWEGGWATLVRSRAPKLIRDALLRPALRPLIVAFDLAVPPLGLLAAVSLAGLAVDGAAALAGGQSLLLVAPWLAAAAAVPLYVFIGLAGARAPMSAYRALFHAPLFILAKPLSLRRTLTFRSDTWVRTERAPDGTDRR
jgi:cellulose synthase/poly-beta-1,6-N-acetylglucosamine synthase-like glycosyltransferase